MSAVAKGSAGAWGDCWRGVISVVRVVSAMRSGQCWVVGALMGGVVSGGRSEE